MSLLFTVVPFFYSKINHFLNQCQCPGMQNNIGNESQCTYVLPAFTMVRYPKDVQGNITPFAVRVQHSLTYT